MMSGRPSCAVTVAVAIAVSGPWLAAAAAADRGAGYAATGTAAARRGAAGGLSHRSAATGPRPSGHDSAVTSAVTGHGSGWYQRGFGGTRDPGWGYRFGPGLGGFGR